MTDGKPELISLRYLEDAPFVVADVSGTGRVDCPCGRSSIGPITFTMPGSSVTLECPHCRRVIEARSEVIA